MNIEQPYFLEIEKLIKKVSQRHKQKKESHLLRAVGNSTLAISNNL